MASNTQRHQIRAYLDNNQGCDLNRLERMVPDEFMFLLRRVLDGYVEACVQRDALSHAAAERDALAKEVKRLRGLLMADVMQGPDAPGPDEAVRDG